ncbi:hypothetical protein ACGFRB_07570 [Streptomyces sp. NPDC048718]|uniref:hypothetical protein n=1 Tax=Streptomyces sp. NPDC048718 TaxID=3365587 RepID=UPI00371041DF
MGWTVLYIAFGVVALWLLGEVLLQYKARLRWRLLAFGGFLGVVLGVLLPSVLVIVIGALAFATGQILVTLSFRRGFSTGWAIGGRPGASRRRRAGGGKSRESATLEVSDLTYEDAAHETGADPAAPADPDAAAPTAVYAAEPMPEDTGNYGVYDGSYGHPAAPAAPADDRTAAYADPYAPGAGYGQHQPAYDYGTGDQQSYAAYSDPYIGGGRPQDPYQQPYADPYASSYGGYDTPPGGVWVPQQRDPGQQPAYPPYPPEQQDPQEPHEPQGHYGQGGHGGHGGHGGQGGNGGDQHYR